MADPAIVIRFLGNSMEAWSNSILIMKIKPVVLSSSYAIFQIGSGLLVHPYQTMQSLVQEKLFVWMVLLPSFMLALVTLGWRFGIVPLVRLIFSCKATAFIGCDALPFVSDWITFFCLYWQILLFYLLFRFTTVFRRA
jgi:hypothetical protein